MATKKISQLEAITEAENSDVLVIVDVSEGTTNKITKNNLLIGAGHTIEMSLNENYQIVLKLKNAEGTELSTATIDLPNENAITNISYSNGTLTLTKQSGVTSTVDISGLINGLATETALTNLANALKETIGIQTNTYDNTKTYNTGDIVVQNEKIYKCKEDNITGTFDSSKWDEISLYEYQKIQDEAIEENYKVITKLQEDVEDLTERVEDAENNQLTNTPEIATSHYLQDSADSRFRKFIPIGRTTQESTTGKNHWNNDKVKTSGIVEKLDTGFKITRNDSTRWGNDLSMSITAGSYKFYGDVKTNASSDRSSFLITYTDDTTRLVAFRLITSHATVDFEKDVKYVRPYIDNDESIGTYYEITDLMILNSTETDTSYEPYTGGEPAPNPNYPYAIKNTGDNGSVNEKVQNKNLLKIQKDLHLIMNSNGTISSGSTSTICQIIDVTNINNLTFNGDFSLTDSQTIRVGLTNDFPAVGVQDTRVDVKPSNKTIDTSNYKYALCTFVSTGGSTTSDIEKSFQIEQGSTATSYVPHSEQNISFSLAQGQKLHEDGTITDGKVINEWGEYVFTGNETFTRDKELTNSYRFYTQSNTIPNSISGTSISTHFKNSSVNSISNIDKQALTVINDNQIVLRINKTLASTVQELKDLLAEWYTNGNPLKVQFHRVTPVEEDFTEEQKTAWKEWQKARTYKNITHISSEDETPANVDITYVQDTKTYIDNKVTELTNAIISLGGNV